MGSQVDDATELADALTTTLSTHLKSPEVNSILRNKVDFRILPIHKNNQAFGIHYSVIIFAAVMKGESNKAYYHGIILEKSNEDPVPTRQNFGNYQIEKTYTASDIYKHDPSFIAKIDGYLKSILPNNSLVRLGFEVLPRLFRYTNDDGTFSQEALSRIIQNAQKPLLIKGVFKELGINPPAIKQLLTGTNEQLTLDINFNSSLDHESTKDIYNNPIRDDIKLVLNKESNDRSKSVFDNKSKNLISETTAFFTTDIINNKVNNLFTNPYQQQQNIPVFGARVVITKSSNAFLDSLEGLLLSLYLNTSLGKNNRWYSAFKPNHSSGKDLRNVGALNIEQNLDNTKGSAFNDKITVGDILNRSDVDAIFPVFMGNVFNPNLGYAIDVGNCQYNSWLLEVFEACLAGNPDAIISVVEAADRLTNGNMSNMFKGNNVIIPKAEQILMGHYHKNSSIRDIRDIDYIYLANYLSTQDREVIKITDENNYDMLVDWTNSINDMSTDPVIRLDVQTRIIQQILGKENVKISGTAQRFTFTADFITALIRAVEATGVMISLTNEHYINNGAVRSTFNQFGDAAVQLHANVNYNSGNGYNPNNGNTFNNYSAF
jgi:hypothetical protein